MMIMNPSTLLILVFFSIPGKHEIQFFTPKSLVQEIALTQQVQLHHWRFSRLDQINP